MRTTPMESMSVVTVSKDIQDGKQQQKTMGIGTFCQYQTEEILRISTGQGA